MLAEVKGGPDSAGLEGRKTGSRLITNATRKPLLSYTLYKTTTAPYFSSSEPILLLCVHSHTSLIPFFILLYLIVNTPPKRVRAAMTTPTASMRPLQDSTMANNFAVTSPQKSPRRVLGELTPNAQLAPKHHQLFAKSPVKTTPRQSPLKAQSELPSPAVLSLKAHHGLTPASASRKRPHSAVDSPERLDAARSPARRGMNMEARTISPSALRAAQPPVCYIKPAYTRVY